MRKFIILICFGIVACNVFAKPIESAENVTEAIDEDYVDWDDNEGDKDTYAGYYDLPEENEDSDDGEEGEEEQEDNEVEDGEQECEAFCPRIYRPVCAEIKGAAVTVPTRCELDNKLRCASATYGPEAAAILYAFLHNGPCGNNESDVADQK